MGNKYKNREVKRGEWKELKKKRGRGLRLGKGI